MALELFSLFEATEVAQGRVDVQQLSRFRADLAALDARPGSDPGDPRPIVSLLVALQIQDGDRARGH